MKLLQNYQAGVNLGGWISQYRRYDHDHFKTFIQEEDIRQIASWGMDHVRLPIDYPVLEDDSNPFVYKEDGFAYIDNCISWCKKYGLNVILDLHRAPGFFFGTLDKNTLFDDENMQERFVRLWLAFTKRYLSEGDNVLFELMNEVVEPTSERWNKLAHRTIKAIREIDPNRVIVYGGNQYNSITMLKEIDIVEDERVVYTFHFYLPFLFTHQKAGWNLLTKTWNKTLHYPGKAEGFFEFLKQHPEFWHGEGEPAGEEPVFNKENMLKDVQPAIDFIESTGKEVYCGEYGVIDVAPRDSRVRWHRDFVDILKELKIGRAVWSYKKMNFGLVDENGNVIDEELVRIVSEK